MLNVSKTHQQFHVLFQMMSLCNILYLSYIYDNYVFNLNV